MDASFYLTWACLLGAPPVAIGTFIVIRRHWPSAISRTATFCFVLIVMVIGMSLLGMSFNSTLANVACISVAYFAYCVLAASCWNLRLLVFRIPALIVAALPIGVGYVLGTIGFLGLAFIVGDYTRPPMQITTIRTDLECRVTGWGMAATDSGYIVHLYKHWPAFPFVEREVSRIVVNETNPAPSPAGASCNDALAAMR